MIKLTSTKRKIIYFFIVIILLLFALLLRSFMFVHGDFYYLVDQGRDLMLVKQIVIEHKLPLIGARAGLGGIFHGPLWLYMIVPFFIAAHGNPFFTLVPLFLIVSLGIVLVGFIIGYKLYNLKTGIIFALILSTAAPLIEVTQSSTNAQVMPLIFLFYLACMLLYLRGKRKAFIFMVLLIGLGFHFESAFAVFLIPLTIVGLLLAKSLPSLRITLAAFIIFFISVSNFLFFELRHRFLMTNSILQLFKGKVQPIRGYERYSDIGYRISDRFSNLKNSFFMPLFQQTALAHNLVVILIFAGVIVFFWNIYKKHVLDKEYLFILLIPVLYYGIYILYPFPLWSHYVLPIIISAALLLTLSINKIFTSLPLKITSILAVIAFIYPAVASLSTLYKSSNYVPKSDGNYLNQVNAVDYVYKDAKGKEFGYFVYMPATFTYNIDYLIWWKGKQYEVTGSNQKHPITYLVMYSSSSSDQGAHDFWKKNVVKTNGKVDLTKQLQGGLIIQRLSIPKNDPSPDPNYYQNLIFR